GAAVIEVRRLQYLAEEPAEEEELLVRVGRRCPAGNLPARLLERIGGEGDGLLVGDFFEGAVAPHPGALLPLALEVRKAEPAAVTEPAVVDGDVLSRLEAADAVAPRVDLDVAAHAAGGTDAGRAIEVPG